MRAGRPLCPGVVAALGREACGVRPAFALGRVASLPARAAVGRSPLSGGAGRRGAGGVPRRVGRRHRVPVWGRSVVPDPRGCVGWRWRCLRARVSTPPALPPGPRRTPRPGSPTTPRRPDRKWLRPVRRGGPRARPTCPPCPGGRERQPAPIWCHPPALHRRHERGRDRLSSGRARPATPCPVSCRTPGAA
jgi:hypothetical protein